MDRRGFLGVLFRGAVIATASTTVIGRAMLEENPIELSTPTNNNWIVCQISDFPSPIDGVIHLEDGVTYQVMNTIEIPKNIKLSLPKNVSIQGNNGRIAIKYTGTGSLFT